MRIQHDLSKMMEKIDRIDSVLAEHQSQLWGGEEDEPIGPPF
jgi:hypothetical protein